MNRILYFITLIFVAGILSACHTSMDVTEEQHADSTSIITDSVVCTVVTTENHIEVADSSETIVWTVITEYDTSRADSTGKSPIRKTTQSLVKKSTGKKSKDNTTKGEALCAAKEVSAVKVTRNNNKRESTKAESKTPLYYAYTVYGVALVILMATLAYWVFSKYRAA